MNKKSNCKITRSAELLWVFGIVCVALGVSLCNKADLGVSMIAAPAFVLSEWLCEFSPFFSVGVTEYVIQGILLLALCITIRRFDPRYILAFATGVIYGYTLNLFLWIFGGVTVNSIGVRWVLLILGDVIVSFGVACFFRTYLPLQVYELFVAELSRAFNFKIGKVKWLFDLSLLALSITLALILFKLDTDFSVKGLLSSSFHNIGLGTFVTTAINSPLIILMGKLVDKIFLPTPLFPKIESILKRK